MPSIQEPGLTETRLVVGASMARLVKLLQLDSQFSEPQWRHLVRQEIELLLRHLAELQAQIFKN